MNKSTLLVLLLASSAAMYADSSETGPSSNAIDRKSCCKPACCPTRTVWPTLACEKCLKITRGTIGVSNVTIDGNTLTGTFTALQGSGYSISNAEFLAPVKLNGTDGQPTTPGLWEIQAEVTIAFASTCGCENAPTVLLGAGTDFEGLGAFGAYINSFIQTTSLSSTTGFVINTIFTVQAPNLTTALTVVATALQNAANARIYFEALCTKAA